MDFDENKVSLKPIIHFKKGEVAIWVGNNQRAKEEFIRSLKEIETLPKSQRSIFKQYEKLVEKYISDKVDNPNQIFMKKLNVKINNIEDLDIEYSIKILNDNQAEIRAELFIEEKYLNLIQYEKINYDESKYLSSNVNLNWENKNFQLEYLAKNIYTYSDLTFYSQIISFNSIDAEKAKTIVDDVLNSFEIELNIIISSIKE